MLDTIVRYYIGRHLTGAFFLLPFLPLLVLFLAFFHTTALTLIALLLFALPAHSETQTVTALSLYDQPKYVSGFPHFDYVNAIAPKGGKITLPALGTFDTLNPYVLKGISPADYSVVYGISEMNETLMVGTSEYFSSGDEPQTGYCLICESLEFPDDYQWVIFYLNQKARFHNGDPITAKDVAHSFKLLTSEKAHPLFASNLNDVAKVETLSKYAVKFHFKGPAHRSSILRLGELPVMSHDHWQKHTFGASSGTPQPLSGPYRIKRFALGNYIILKRVEDFWAKDHPVYQGMFNFDEVRFDFYRDRTVAFEAFKSGNLDFWIEYVSKNWATAYNFPAIHNGKVLKRAIPHTIPSGSQAFFLNMHREPFRDRRVRKAISLMFDFQWTNKNIFSNAYKRSETHYPNSIMGATGLPSEAEQQLLAPFAETLPPELFSQEFHFRHYDTSSALRDAMKEAIALLQDAGWVYQNITLVYKKTGKPFRFEILNDSPSFQRVLLPFIKNLKRIGITAHSRIVDTAQYKVRLDEFDYDMTVYVLPQTASPGQEQRLYFHSSQANRRGSRNLSNIKNPTVDFLIDSIARAQNHDELVTSVRALDRVLLWNYYTIPQWYLDYHRIAYKKRFRQPVEPAKMRLGFQTWWIEK